MKSMIYLFYTYGDKVPRQNNYLYLILYFYQFIRLLWKKKSIIHNFEKKKSLQKSKAVSSNFCDTKSKINLMKLLFASKYITIIC